MTAFVTRPSEDVAAALADFCAGLTFEALPAEVVSLLKRSVLDTFGVSLAANTLGTAVPELVDVARSVGETPESSIIGFGSRVSAPMAAFVNGSMAHSLNYDDVSESGGHVGATTLPSALAVAERVGDVSGRDLLTALAGGAEVLSRLGDAVIKSEGGVALTRAPRPLRIQLWGYFSAAVSAGRVLRLRREQMHSALGLALMQATGNWQPVLEGSPAKIYTGFSNLGGTLAALLSQGGVRLDCAAFEGEAGLFRSFYGSTYLRSMLVDGLGEDFHLRTMRFKAWPTTGVAHPFIAAALALVEAERIRHEAVGRILLTAGPRIRHHFEPAVERLRPKNGASAGDSVPFAVAKALANRQVGLADFTAEGLLQPEVAQLLERMDCIIDPDLGDGGAMEVIMADGRRLAARLDGRAAEASGEVSQAQLVSKFFDCARYAAQQIPRERLERVVELVDRLETLPDVAILPALLSGGESS